MGKYSMRSSNFRRYPDDGYVAGVCAGIASYLDWNVRLIRALAILSFVFGGGFPIVLVYALLWYVMEKDSGRPRSHHDDPPAYHNARYREESGPSRGMSTRDLKTRFSNLERRLSSMEECVTSNDYELRRELRKLES